MTISLSVRTLLDLIAVRLTRERFQHAIGVGDSRGRANLFMHCLDRDEVISAIRLEPSGVDEDDDCVGIEFPKDPSASALPMTRTGGSVSRLIDWP